MTHLPDGWESAPLSSLARMGSGGTPTAGNPNYYGGGIPWAVIGDLNDGLVTTTKRSLTQLGLESSAAKLVPAGALLVAMYGSIGKLGIAGTELTTNQAIAFIVPNLRVVPKYLFYFLLSQRERLDSAGKGATQRNISQTILRSWPIVFPTNIAEQQRIVAILDDHLSRLDAAEEYLRASRRRLVGLRERTVADAITGEHVLGGRVPVALDQAGTSDGDLPSLPMGWAWSRLGNVADVVGGVTKDAKKQSDPALPAVPYLRVANVQRGRLDLTEVSTIRVTPGKAATLRLQPGDVLLNEGGDRDKLARGWVWEGQIEVCIHQNHVFRARITDPRVDPYFLAWTTNTFGGRWAERNGKQSVNLASISLSRIKQLPVIVPPPGVGASIAARLAEDFESLTRLESAVIGATARASALRRSLLAAAFTGALTSGYEPEEGVA